MDIDTSDVKIYSQVYMDIDTDLPYDESALEGDFFSTMVRYVNYFNVQHFSGNGDRPAHTA